MKLRRFSLLVLPLLVLPLFAPSAYADAVLGTELSTFAVLAGSTVTDVPLSSIIVGNVGVSPGSSITGLLPAQVTGGTIQPGSEGLAQGQLTTAYNSLAATPFTASLTGTDLGSFGVGGLAPGVYNFSSSAQLTGALILNGGGDPNALWIFQIGSTLTTASGSSVAVTNAGSGAGVYWQVGSSATLGSGTAFEGNIVALTSIGLDTGATIDCGRALARNGAVTLDHNSISNTCANVAGLGGTGGLSGGTLGTGGTVSPVPEPGTLLLLSTGIVALVGKARMKRGRRGTTSPVAAV
ncbi:MAG TPA: ice-binding family protein [Candidatus Acidoferrum sp.]|nr:ice-binding family protein [Candidatus Acidoferrum sp.]